MKGYYLTYNDGNGIFGYCGDCDTTPKHYTARRFAIIPAEGAEINNK